MCSLAILTIFFFTSSIDSWVVLLTLAGLHSSEKSLYKHGVSSNLKFDNTHDQ